MNPLLLLVFLSLFVLQNLSFANEAVELPPNFRLEEVATNLGLATGFAFAEESRLFVATKDGLVRVVQDGVLLSNPFIDLSHIVNDAGDRGLTDVAVHPDFPAEPYIYVAYVYDPPEINGMSGLAALDARGRRVSRLTRFTADPNDNYNRALPASELHIIGANSLFETMGSPDLIRDQGQIACMQGDSFIADCLPSDDYSHVVGSIMFAEDGSLYMGYGDGATVAPHALPITLRTLDLDSMAGKILRVNPETGQGYADNPFYDGDLDSNRSKVINYGLRNPYSLTIDPLTNKLYMVDTGWISWEELNEGRGKNFGWPCYEGGSRVNRGQPVYAAVCDDYLSTQHDATPALFAYEHASKGGAVTGLEVYLGSQYPEEYKGAIFYSDFVRSEVSVVRLNDGYFQGVSTFAAEWPGISKIRRGPDGDLFFTDIFNGTLNRLVYDTEGSNTPTAKITAEPFYGEVPLEVMFSGSSSRNPLSGKLSYYWKFGDGTSSNGETLRHDYINEGEYLATLEVTNSAGLSDTTDFTVYAGRTAAQIDFAKPLLSDVFANGDEVTFEATVNSIDSKFDLSQARYDWRASVSHGSDQPLSLEMASVLKGKFTFPELQADAHVLLCLLVTSAEGFAAERCIKINPMLANVSLKSEPTGFELNLNGQSVVTPHEALLHVGSITTVSGASNNGYKFDAWSNNESKTHSIIVPESGALITALYVKSASSGSVGMAMWLILFGGLLRYARSGGTKLMASLRSFVFSALPHG